MSRKLLFISSTVHHNKFRDRLSAAIDAGYEVSIVAYDRKKNELDRTCSNDFSSINLQIAPLSTGRGAISRLSSAVKLALKIIAARIKLGKPDVILVNNAELLILATILLFDRCRRIYDLADVHPIQYGEGAGSRLFRGMEACALRLGCWEVAVTSPWFYWRYLLPFLKIKNRCYLIENKLVGRRDDRPPVQANGFVSGRPVAVAWTGLLRCDRSFEILLSLCEIDPHSVRLHLIGIADNLSAELLCEAHSLNNVSFLGAYLEQDLGDKLTESDYLWACDFSDGLNSELLLPNRLYQGIYYGKPVIGAAGTAAGSVIDKLNIGLVLTERTGQALSQELRGVTESQYNLWISNCRRLRERVLRRNEWRDFLLSSELEGVPQLSDIEDMSLILKA